MKEIDVLLERYAEGNLTDEEQVRLNQLTHRDEVLAAAGARAHRLKRNRRTAISVLAALLVVVSVGTTLSLRPDTTGTESAVVARTDVAQEAKAAVPEVEPVKQQQVVRQQAPAAERTFHEKRDSQPKCVEQVVADPLLEVTETPVHFESDAVVACNTQCSPDSVISDIWKFLKA